jgi:hypothetical protein
LDQRLWDRITEIGQTPAGKAEVSNLQGLKKLHTENKPRREEETVTYNTMCSTIQLWCVFSMQNGPEGRKRMMQRKHGESRYESGWVNMRGRESMRASLASPGHCLEEPTLTSGDMESSAGREWYGCYM